MNSVRSLHFLSDPVVDWLLEPTDPSVRYHTLTTLLGQSPDEPAVLAARRAVMAGGLVPKILAGQNADGSWSDPARFYRDKYTGTVWTLLILAELAADPDDPRLRSACEFILANSQNPESGGFSCDRSAKTGAGLASYVIPCLTGNMVYSLIRLGYLDDPRLQRAINWITTWQRADDGAAAIPKNAVYDRFEMCWGRHSCHMGVAKAFKALAAIPPARRSPAAAAKLGEIGEYFLLHHLYKKSHNLAEISRPGWLNFGFPLMYQTDILELLGIFAGLGQWDDRLQDALGVVTGKRQANGQWNLENSFNGKMQVRIEQKGKPSKWITLRALQVHDQFGGNERT
jgi:hypothetical protein